MNDPNCVLRSESDGVIFERSYVNLKSDAEQRFECFEQQLAGHHTDHSDHTELGHTGQAESNANTAPGPESSNDEMVC